MGGHAVNYCGHPQHAGTGSASRRAVGTGRYGTLQSRSLSKNRMSSCRCHQPASPQGHRGPATRNTARLRDYCNQRCQRHRTARGRFADRYTCRPGFAHTPKGVLTRGRREKHGQKFSKILATAIVGAPSSTTSATSAAFAPSIGRASSMNFSRKRRA